MVDGNSAAGAFDRVPLAGGAEVCQPSAALTYRQDGSSQ
jgi:hypothetical protein